MYSSASSRSRSTRQRSGADVRCLSTAALTLQNLKTKGQQRVIVKYQQVNVADGGQAVLATTIRRARGAAGGGVAKGKDEPHAKRRGWLKNGNRTSG
jgi:hypothetical protein